MCHHVWFVSDRISSVGFYVFAQLKEAKDDVTIEVSRKYGDEEIVVRWNLDPPPDSYPEDPNQEQNPVCLCCTVHWTGLCFESERTSVRQ